MTLNLRANDFRLLRENQMIISKYMNNVVRSFVITFCFPYSDLPNDILILKYYILVF